MNREQALRDAYDKGFEDGVAETKARSLMLTTEERLALLWATAPYVDSLPATRGAVSNMLKAIQSARAALESKQ